MNSLNLDNKLYKFEIFVNNYIEIIDNLINISITNNILPYKLLITIPFLKDYIKNNKIDILEYGVKYLLPNKEDILNFTFDNLNELDEDSNDNISIKKCIDNISTIKSDLKNPALNINDNELLNLIIEIKNNSKVLDKVNIELINNYIKLLIIVLEEIKNIFI
jgi:hypothetical protein